MKAPSEAPQVSPKSCRPAALFCGFEFLLLVAMILCSSDNVTLLCSPQHLAWLIFRLEALISDRGENKDKQHKLKGRQNHSLRPNNRPKEEKVSFLLGCSPHLDPLGISSCCSTARSVYSRPGGCW